MLSREELDKIKRILFEAHARKWASIIAIKCECTEDYVRKVFLQQYNDTKRIVPTALELIDEYRAEQQALKDKFNKLVS